MKIEAIIEIEARPEFSLLIQERTNEQLEQFFKRILVDSLNVIRTAWEHEFPKPYEFTVVIKGKKND